MENYVYQRISNSEDTIRVLVLEPYLGPVNENAPVKCRLEECLIPEAVTPDREAYEALSYCWGDAAAQKIIECDGHPVHVTQSLHSALLQLRRGAFDGPRRIWADAICINQQDLEEKSQQVRMMGRIYRRASNVLVWLGPVTGKLKGSAFSISQGALSQAWLDRLWHAFLAYTANQETRTYMQLSKEEQNSYGLDYYPSDRRWYELLELAGHPWFTRMWIVQEIALAQHADVICGECTISWEKFRQLYFFVFKTLGFGILQGTRINPDHWLRLERLSRCADCVARGDSQPLWTLLVNHRHAQASTPIDKVYALCGLATDVQSGELDISIDYTRDYRFALIETTRAIIQRKQSIDIITCAGLAPDADQPSWVPDMRHAHTKTTWIGTLTIDGRVAFCASGGSRLGDQPDHDIDLLRLRLKGYILDVIDEVGIQARPLDMEPTESSSSSRTGTRGIQDEMKMLWNWIRVTCQASPDAPYAPQVGGRGTRLDAYWQTVIGGLRGRDFETVQADFKVWYESNPYARAVSGLAVAHSHDEWPSKMLWYGSGVLNTAVQVAKVDGAATIKAASGLVTAAVGIHDVLVRGRGGQSLGFATPPLQALAGIASRGSTVDHASRLSEARAWASNLWSTALQQQAFFRHSTGAHVGRRMFRTRDGWIGLGAGAVQAGDKIAILQGASVPVVVRPSSDWVVVGDCYVHGVMEGQAWEPRWCEDMWFV